MRRPRRRIDNFVPRFVDSVPGQLEEGYLYVSLRYRTVTHLCACGCGVEVNTPLHPTGWAVTYDGLTMSLWPSVGNWSEECRSHYLIEKNIVRWSQPWSRAEILGGRAKRRRDIKEYHGDKRVVAVEPDLEGGSGRNIVRRLDAVIAWLRRQWSALRRKRPGKPSG